MHQTHEFIAALHVIAAGETSEDRQEAAVAEVFARYLREVGAAVRGDPGKLRGWVTELQGQLQAPPQASRTGRFTVLRAHAEQLAADWLKATRSD